MRRPPGGLLASDQDRDDTVRALRGHFASGRLDRAEFESRIEAAYSARTRGELRSLLSSADDYNVLGLGPDSPWYD